MRDIPMFATENGIAGLVLREIPAKKTAYIHIKSSLAPEKLLSDCVDFCRAAGAEAVYAAGSTVLSKYPHYTTVCTMRGSRAHIEDDALCLFPVTEKTWQSFCRIYNEKMASVPTAATLRLQDREEYERGAYFVHSEGSLKGIGIVSDNRILAVAACEKGAGRQVLGALCKALPGDTVELEVAENNAPAMALYARCGFIKTGEVARWYKIL